MPGAMSDSGLIRRFESFVNAQTADGQFVDVQLLDPGTIDEEAADGDGADGQRADRQRAKREGTETLCAHGQGADADRTEFDEGEMFLVGVAHGCF